MKTVGERIKFLRGDKPQRWLAEQLGIPQTTLSNYENGKSELSFATADAIASLFDVHVEWLIFGRTPGESSGGGVSSKLEDRVLSLERQLKTTQGNTPEGSWQPPVFVAHPTEGDPWKNTNWQEVPVIGLGNCGNSDWYSPSPLALRTSLPVDYPYRPEMFAVLAVGSSMQPEGIRQGYVLFCDPQANLEPGDAIYIEKKDGTASIKKFLKLNDTLHVQGWHPPVQDGSQKPYFEEIEKTDILRLACVVVIKRKG